MKREKEKEKVKNGEEEEGFHGGVGWRRWRRWISEMRFWSGWSSLYIGRGTNQFRNWFASSETALNYSTCQLQQCALELPKDQAFRGNGKWACNDNISVLDFAKYLYTLDLCAFDFRVFSDALFLFAILDSVLQHIQLL